MLFISLLEKIGTFDVTYQQKISSYSRLQMSRIKESIGWPIRRYTFNYFFGRERFFVLNGNAVVVTRTFLKMIAQYLKIVKTGRKTLVREEKLNSSL